MSHPTPRAAHHDAHHEHPDQHQHEHRHASGDRPAHDHEHCEGGDQAEILDLDAEVLAQHTASIAAWLPITTSPRNIVDLGCGTGAGTLALLERFPQAELTAVDSSPAHLRRLSQKPAATAAAARLRLVQADLDASPWPGLGTPELVWASASMHHMADPGRTLRQVHELLAPGGLFAVVELAGFPRFLPHDAPREAPGLEERCHAALAQRHARQVSHRGADWGPMLTEAGFTIEGERTLTVDTRPPHTDAAGRYALSGLRRIRAGAAPALDQLLDTDGPFSILRRGDLSVRTERTVWAARRMA